MPLWGLTTIQRKRDGPEVKMNGALGGPFRSDGMQAESCHRTSSQQRAKNNSFQEFANARFS